MNGIYAALDRFFLPLLEKGQAAYQNQKDTKNTTPVWVALLVSCFMVFLDVSAMNVLTIIMAGVFALFAFTGKEGHDPLTSVDKWRLFAPMAIITVPSILCIGQVDGFLLSTLGWINVAAATMLAIVASHRIMSLQDKNLPALMKVLTIIAVPLYVLLKPVLYVAEQKYDWMVQHWRPVMVWGAWCIGFATVWYPLPVDDLISIGGGVLGAFFGVMEFRGRSGEQAARDRWAVYGASVLSFALGVLCLGNMFASFGWVMWAALVSAVSFVFAGYVVSKTHEPAGEPKGLKVRL